MFAKSNMTRRTFLLEGIVYVFLLTSAFITYGQNDQLKRWVSILEPIIIISMFYQEGGKPYSALYFMVLFAEIMQFFWIHLILLGTLSFYFLKYRFYQIKVFDKGAYDIGFRYLKIEDQQLAIFYPTIQGGKQPLWIQTKAKNYFKDLYDISFLDPLKCRWVPLFVFKFFTSYMAKAQIPANEGTQLYITNPNQPEFTVLLFSHGLASNMTSHSSYCCWLASQGNIVISIQHSNDLIRFHYDEQLVKKKELFTKIMYVSRNHDLEVRCKQMEALYIDLIGGNLLGKIFPQNESVGIKQIHFAGHSFGGATCLETLSNLQHKRINLDLIREIICIDPWVYPLSDSTLSKTFDKQITIINSQKFIQEMPSEYNLRQNLKRIQCNNVYNIKSFVIMGSDHIFSTDFVFVCGNGVKKIVQCINHDESHLFYSMLQIITRLTIQGHNKQEILEHSKQMFSQNMFQNICVKEEWRYENEAIDH